MSLTRTTKQRLVTWAFRTFFGLVAVAVFWSQVVTNHSDRTWSDAIGLTILQTLAIVGAVTLLVILERQRTKLLLQWKADTLAANKDEDKPSIDWERTRPETALSWSDVRPGDRIKTYVPDDSSSVRRYEILPTSTTDSRDDLLVSFRNLETGVVSTNSTAHIGLSCSPDGRRYCWAIPDDTDN